MKYLMIANQGEVDPRAFTLLGASVKEGDDAIGMFGSGTKYSLATLVRNGLPPIIFAGEERIEISAKTTNFRGQSFEVITINGQETSITTETGKKWVPTHCVREFWSNAQDEGGAEWAITDEVFGEPGTTRIFIPINDAINDMIEHWDMYYLSPNASPIHSDINKNHVLAPSDTNNTPVIYRRGIWCVEDWGQYEPLFSYNLHDVSLPETRLVNATHTRYNISYLLQELEDEEAILSILKEAENHNCFEWACLTSSFGAVNNAYKKVFDANWKYVATRRDLDFFPSSMRPHILVCDNAAMRVLRTLGCPDVFDFRNSDQLYTEMSWPIGYADRVQAAVRRMEKHGFAFPYKLKFVRFPGEDSDNQTIAMADMRTKTCLLTQKAFEDPNDLTLMKALVEEWTHLAHGVNDGSRGQQHVYLETIVRLMK